MNRVSRRKALLVALIALIGGGLSYLFGVGSSLGQRAEASVLDASAFTFDPPPPLSLVSVPAVAIALLVITILAWIVHGAGRALWFAIFGFAAIAISQLLKQELLARPELFELDAPNTFPSGHMTVFAIISGGLIWAVPERWRAIVGLAAAVLMGTVAWQLLEYGWHRPSDVLGALALGVLTFALAAALRLPRRSRTVRVPSSASVALTKVLGAILTVAGVVIVAGGVILIAAAAGLGSDTLMLAASEISVVGVSALAARAMVTVSG